jgi:four helix bundle protein
MSGGRFQGDLPLRTLNFAETVLRLVPTLPPGTVGWLVARQLARCGTSVGANVREADHALTEAEFAHKCSIARKEASETEYWLILCQRINLLSEERVVPAMQEAGELMRILSTIVRKTHQSMEMAP